MGQRSAFIGSVWVFRPESNFSTLLRGPPKVVVVHQSTPRPGEGGAGGAQTTWKHWGSSSYGLLHPSAPGLRQEEVMAAS